MLLAQHRLRLVRALAADRHTDERPKLNDDDRRSWSMACAFPENRMEHLPSDPDSIWRLSDPDVVQVHDGP